VKIAFDDLLEEREVRFKIAPDWNSSTVDELAAAFEYFCSTYWFIRHPSRGRIKFLMSDAQKATVHDWLEHKNTLILKARQLGFSTLLGAFVLWAAYFYPDRHIILLSKTERDAIKLLAKTKYGFKYLPEWMKLRGPIWESKQTELAFSNESKIESLPSGNDPARGEAVWLVGIDEWAFLPNPDEAWAAIEPIADVGGRVIGLSTANGEGNVFFDHWSKSKNYGIGTGRFWGIFHPWWADGEGKRDADWYATKQADLPDWQLAQEYPDNPDDAFLRSGRPVFKLDRLKAIEVVMPRRGFLKQTPEGGIEFEEDGGPLRVWEEPRVGGRYVMGVDVAEGLEHGDFTSIHVLDARNKRLVAHWHGHIDPDLLGEELLPPIGRWYNNALAGVERNNHGLTTLKALQRAQYRPIFFERQYGKRTQTPSDRYGFHTTRQSKPMIIDELSKLLRDAKLYMPDHDTRLELQRFVREGDGKMHGSPYDDRTMSLAIAVHMLEFAFVTEFEVDEKPGPGTMGWFEQMMYPKERSETAPIGSHSVRR